MFRGTEPPSWIYHDHHRSRDSGASVARVRAASRRLWRRLALLLAVLGPGIITSNVDNDAGGISTYSLAGAHFGYLLLWSLIPMTIALM